MVFGLQRVLHYYEATEANFILYSIVKMKSLCNVANKVTVTVEDENWVKRTQEFTNITCTAGRTQLAQRLIDTTTDLGVAKYIAVGDGVTAPAESDIGLTNEIVRSAIITDLSTNTTTSTNVYARFWRGDSLVLHEAGLFIWPTATSTNGSGALLCHSLFGSTVTKSAVEILTIQWTINVLNYVI